MPRYILSPGMRRGLRGLFCYRLGRGRRIPFHSAELFVVVKVPPVDRDGSTGTLRGILLGKGGEDVDFLFQCLYLGVGFAECCELCLALKSLLLKLREFLALLCELGCE